MAHRVFLETPRLVLREFTEDDLPLLIELDSDPEVMRHLAPGQPVDVARLRDFVLPLFLDFHRRTPDYGFWAAHERATDEFVGWFHLRPHKTMVPPVIELGYRLRRSAWGRGYATEASCALLDRGFGQLGLDRVVATTMAANAGSRAVMEKCGLVFVRNFVEEHFPGEDKRAVLYEIRREDWVRARLSARRPRCPPTRGW